MAEPSAASFQHTATFGPFRLLPAQQLLLEGEAPVRLGSRALEILTTLVGRTGELVSKSELMARVWPDTFVDEGSLRVHIAGLRRALGDGQPGRRYLATVPGRGYRFVAPVSFSGPERPSDQAKAVLARVHNLPLSQSRAVGRTDVIGALLDQLPKMRFVTIVGAGGIGKTTVALAMAEALIPAYEDGVWLVDLAPVDDPQLVSGALGTALGLSVHPNDAVSHLIDFLRDKEMLIVLDSCEHVTDTAAVLVEQILASVPGIHVLATSREPLRINSERVHRLAPLESPPQSSDLTAAEALAFPSVQLFVERAAAILDGFQLSDADAPILSDICRKLDGIALAIEIAAARTDAFSIPQLSVLLDNRFRILKQGMRAGRRRHQTLAAALDWSYEFLPEVERIVLRRFSVFAGTFTLESAVAVAGDDDIDVVDAVANLVGKSLMAADVGGPIVRYRLLDTTRAYAMQKLIEAGESEDYARRHARHHFDWFKRAEANWVERSGNPQWLKDNGRGVGDVRSALNWAFSPDGDPAFGVALTIASLPLWLAASLVHECRANIERALASQALRPTHSERDELKLRLACGYVLPHTTRSLSEDNSFLAKTLALAEKLDDLEAQLEALNRWSVYCLYVGRYREALALAERHRTLADSNGLAEDSLISGMMAGTALQNLGDYTGALRNLDPIINQPASRQGSLVTDRLVAWNICSNILWLRGFPDQAIRCAQTALVEAQAVNSAWVLSNSLAHAACSIALYVGDMEEAERSIRMLLDCSAKSALNTWNAMGRCFQGRLLLAQGNLAGLAILRTALDWLRKSGFVLRYAISLGALAEGLTAAGQFVDAHRAIDEALERTERNEELWCMPELLRIKGELLRLDRPARGNQTAADYFQRALDLARAQEALSWELRAAMSLAKLWHQDGKTAEASNLLATAYRRFSEGFETADLKCARALIHAFGEAPKTQA